MKKLLLIIAAIFTLTGVHADLILHESFNREVGKLNSGAIPSSTITDTDNWYTKNASAKNIITVAEGSLSYPNYVTTGTGNKALLITANSSLSQDMRMLKTTVDKGKVYLSAIINIDELNKTDNGVKGTGAYCLCFGEGSTSASKLYARLYIRSVKEGEEYVGFQMGVAKNNESTAGTAWTETIYKEKNDTARLYVNPTKNTTTPTLTCIQSAINSNNIEQGACGKDDATIISSIHLNETLKNNPNRLYIDELKVATAWDDLFESGDTPIEENPEITTSLKNISFGTYGTVYEGETYTKTFVVKGKNLKGDITLSTDNTQLTLDKTTITKAEAESENGVEVTATLAPTAAGYPEEGVTILLSTEGTTLSILTYWNVLQATICNTVADLKAEAAKGEGWNLTLRFKGEALVTYVSRPATSGTTIYIQDNTAAVSIIDSSWPTSIKVGDKLTDFTVKEGEPAFGVQPLISELPTITIISSDNEVIPQVVTLAELKANAANYLMKLVKVENVTLDQTTTKFGQTTDDNTPIADTFTQDGNTATINLVEGNELINAVKPKKADVIGISSSAAGNVIRVRGAADIISKDSPTAIDNIALDVLNGDYEIYTVSGQRIDALQSGINIIRQGNNTYKVVR